LSSPAPTYFLCNNTRTTCVYTLSLHDALPIFQAVVPAVLHEGGGRGAHGARQRQRVGKRRRQVDCLPPRRQPGDCSGHGEGADEDRKSTRLNSSHVKISYAVFCLKKKREHNHG